MYNVYLSAATYKCFTSGLVNATTSPWPLATITTRTVYFTHCSGKETSKEVYCSKFAKDQPIQQQQQQPFNGLFSRTTWVSQYQKGKSNLDFTGARDSESQWHQLGHMQVCTSLQTDNHASTPPLRFLQAGCPSCHPTNSVKALKATNNCDI